MFQWDSEAAHKGERAVFSMPQELDLNTQCDEDELAAIRLLRGEGWSLGRIARALKIGRSTVHRRLGELDRLNLTLTMSMGREAS